MKSAAISRFVVLAAVLALISLSTPLLAQISFTEFNSTNVTSLTPNGSAALAVNASSQKVLRLTPDGTPHVSGTAWFNTPQPVTGTFSTTFKFQITHNPSAGGGPADGLAFVIQNSSGEGFGLNALGGSGGAVGYGVPDTGAGDIGTAIPSSVAIEFDTYQNVWDPDANHVAVQSCGTMPNSQDHTSSCKIGIASLGTLVNLSDNLPHVATITFGAGKLDVILDNHDLFPAGLPIDWSIFGLTNGSAYVGFTGSTGGAVENNDILSWTFTPQAQSGALPAVGTPAVISFQGGPANNAYNYTAVLTSGGVTSATAQINPILVDQQTCNKLVQKSFPLTQCFVYHNAGKDSSGTSVDRSVLFELTCPDQVGGTCGDIGPANFFADLGSNFTFTKAENPGFQLLNSTIGPYAGWLKGSGLDLLHPCTPNPNGTTPLFASNQISSFSVVGDPLGTTKGKSGGGGSCWVATFFTAGELPPGVKITSPTLATYTKGSVVTASYTCSNPKSTKAASNPTGPYLTVATCTQSQAPNTSNQTQVAGCVPGNVCTGGVDTATKGLHAFTVTSKDSGGNVGANVVIYNVK